MVKANVSVTIFIQDSERLPVYKKLSALIRIADQSNIEVSMGLSAGLLFKYNFRGSLDSLVEKVAKILTKEKFFNLNINNGRREEESKELIKATDVPPRVFKKFVKAVANNCHRECMKKTSNGNGQPKSWRCCSITG